MLFLIRLNYCILDLLTILPLYRSKKAIWLMTVTKDLNTWEEFQFELRKIKLDFPRSTILYRGHSDATWTIQSTLERSNIPDIDTWSKYLTMIGTFEDEITSFTGRDLQVPEYGEFIEKVKVLGQDMLLRNFPAYPFLLYLRHHGFPSPLVDWSMSPFIAAFFAFRTISSTAPRVSINAFIHTLDGGTFTSESESFIKTWRPDTLRAGSRAFPGDV